MASAHAKFIGELGVCIATSGPGAAYLVTGLYDARLDHMPMLAITGQQARMALGGHSGIGYRAPRVVPNDRDQQQAADLLNAGKKVAGFFPAAFSAAMATSSARE